MTVDSGANADQIAYWNNSAGATWAALQDRLDRQIEPLGQRAMDAGAPKAGEQVLDIGCGCGQTSLELAQRVGPTGQVLGVDISEPMLEVARRRGGEAGMANVSFLAADAQTQAFPPGGFDRLLAVRGDVLRRPDRGLQQHRRGPAAGRAPGLRLLAAAG